MQAMNVGIIGYRFMGKAHSNAWIKAPLFFDLNIKPVLKTACGRDQSAVSGLCGKLGLGKSRNGLEKGGGRP